MVKKLKLLLINPTGSRLLYKTSLETLALILVALFNFTPLIITGFFLLSVFLYFTENQDRKSIRISYWLFLIFAVFVFSIFFSLNLPVLLIILAFFVFALIFFVLLGLINFLFMDKQVIYGFLNTIFIFFIFIMFNLQRGNDFWAVLLFVLILLVFKETFVFFNVPGVKKQWTLSLIFSFLALEIAWLVNFLPLGIINSAAFLTLFFLLLRDSLIVHFKGFLTPSFVLRQLTFFVFISLVIFATSKWAI